MSEHFILNLTRPKLLFCLRFLVAVLIALYLGQMVLGMVRHHHNLMDAYDLPVGTDYLGFYAAGKLALDGNPAGAYDLSQMHAQEKTIIGPEAPPIPFFYPPTFLFVMVPLARLPYLVSLAVWMLSTLGVFLFLVHRIAPDKLTTWLALAFPGTYQNLVHSQGGFLSASLLAGGLLLLDNFPITAGILLGLLSYKPNLAVLVPIALIAGRRWRTLAAAAVSGAALALATLPWFGLHTWQALWTNMPLLNVMIHKGYAPHFKMPTVFIATILAGGSYPLAYILQGLTFLGVAVAVAWVWSRPASLPLRAAALCLGVLLATPYAFSYDLAILALPMAWLGWEGYKTGWLSGELAILVIGWIMPLLAPMLAKSIHVQIGPLVLGALFFLVLRRTARREVARP